MAEEPRPHMQYPRKDAPVAHRGAHRKMSDCVRERCVPLTAASSDATDAARYRWLRAHSQSHDIVLTGSPFSILTIYEDGASLDHLIDREIAMETHPDA